MTATVIALADVRASSASSYRLTVEEVEARVQRVREALAFSLAELSSLRADGAHLVAGFGTWHEACEAWFGDLRALRLTGSPEAVAERRALVESMRRAAVSQGEVRRRLGVGAGTVADDLRAMGDPAPERVESADGRLRPSRTGRKAPQEAPQGRVWQQAAEWLRRHPGGLTLVELARVAGWTEGKASGALSDVRRRGLARRVEDRRDGQRVHLAVVEGEVLS